MNKGRLANQGQTEWTRLRRSGYFHVQLSLVLMAVVGFLTTMLLARMLTDVQIGQINIVTRVLTFALIPALWGMDLTACRYAALAEDSPGKQRGVLFFLFALVSPASLLTAGGVYLLLTFGHLVHDPGAQKLARQLIWVLPLMAWIDGLLGYLQGQKRLKSYGWSRAGRQVLLAALVVFMVPRAGLPGWMAARYSAEMLAFFLLIALVGRSRHRAVFPGRGERREMAAYGGWAMITSASLSLLFIADVLFLDHFTHNTAGIGHYAIARYVLDGLLLAPLAMMKTLFPYTAALGRDWPRLWRHFSRAFVRLLPLIAGLTLVAEFLAGWLPFFFGEAYGPSVFYLRLLLPAFFFQALALLFRQTVMAAGLARSTSFFSILVGVFNVAALIVALPVLKAGIGGAIIATVLTHLLSALLPLGQLLWLRKKGRMPSAAEGT